MKGTQEMDAGMESDQNAEGTAVTVTTLLALAACTTAMTGAVGEAPLNSVEMVSGQQNQPQPIPPTD
jgi:hypothetical protein